MAFLQGTSGSERILLMSGNLGEYHTLLTRLGSEGAYDPFIPSDFFTPHRTYYSSIYGAEGDDYLQGGSQNDTLDGGEGKDILDGGSGDDILYGESDSDILYGGLGINQLDGGSGYDRAVLSQRLENVDFHSNRHLRGFLEITDSSVTDYLKDIEEVQFLGSDDAYRLYTVDGSFTPSDLNKRHMLLGGAGDDDMGGGNKNDVFFGRAGNDKIYGADGYDQAYYQGGVNDYTISASLHNGWDISGTQGLGRRDGRDFVDSDVEAIVFQHRDNAKVRSIFNTTTQSTTVSAVAGVGPIANDIKVEGANFGPTDYVIGLSGSVGSYLDFNVELLGDFINDITLPNQNIEAARLGTNAVISSIAEGVPFLGPFQEVVNWGLDQAQIKAQLDATQKLLSDVKYDSLNWGNIGNNKRDTVVIKDFQLGVDNIILPKDTTANSLEIAVGKRDIDGDGVRENGVNIKILDGQNVEPVVFIANNYQTNGVEKLTQGEFKTMVESLFKGNSTISTISNTVVGQNITETIDKSKGTTTYGHDKVDAKGGNDTVLGYFGHDYIEGGKGDDKIYGGFNGDINEVNKNLGAAFQYKHDGDDTLKGGEGDDELYGESGNDTLTGDQGADILDGGSGNLDIASYATETGLYGIVVDLSNGLASDTFRNQDKLISIEGIVGSKNRDRMWGDSHNNIFTGGEGNDYIDGRGGRDTAVFSGKRADYTIVGSNGDWTVTGADGTDTLKSIEILEFKGDTAPIKKQPSPHHKIDNVAFRHGNTIRIDTDLDGSPEDTFSFGNSLFEDQYLFGDWNGDGTDDIAARRGNTIRIDTDFDGSEEISVSFGNGRSENQYLVGDWDGDGSDGIAVRRGNAIHIDNNLDGYEDQLIRYGLGIREDQYLVGDWDGNGIDDIAVRRDNRILIDTNFDGAHDIDVSYDVASTRDQFLVGDWDGNGIDDIAFRLGSSVYMDTNLDGADDMFRSLGPLSSEYLVAINV